MNGLQLLLLLITLVAVCVAIFWGIKRFKRLRYGRIKTKLRYQTGDSSEMEEAFRSELPSGGARLVEIRDPDDIETVNNRIREQAEANKPKLSRSPSQQAALDLGLDDDHNDPHIPVLLDPADELSNQVRQEQLVEEVTDELSEELSVEAVSIPELEVAIEPEPAELEITELAQPEFVEPDVEIEVEPELELFEADESEPQPSETEQYAQDPQQEKLDHSILFSAPETTEKHPFQRDSSDVKSKLESKSKRKSAAETTHTQEPLAEEPLADATHKESSTDKEPSAESSTNKEQEPSAKEEQEQPSVEPAINGEQQQAAAHAEQKQAPVDEVIIINLMATAEGDEFRGTELCSALETQGLKQGNMDIFHFDSGTGSETIRFSVANVLNPGTFPTEKREYFYTPGICFFMTLTPGVSNLQAFNKLLSAARGVASKLGGELQDQERNYLTHQRIESIRTQMGEFQRNNLQA